MPSLNGLAHDLRLSASKRDGRSPNFLVGAACQGSMLRNVGPIRSDPRHAEHEVGKHRNFFLRPSGTVLL